MTLGSVLIIVAVVSLVSAFIILLAMKVGIIEWMQVHGDKFISELAKCNFCLSFWTCMLLTVFVCCWYDEPLYIFAGVFSCGITRRLI